MFFSISGVKSMKRSNVMSHRWKRRRNVTLLYVPVWVELRQIPVIHILQSLLGRVTALRDKDKVLTEALVLVVLSIYS